MKKFFNILLLLTLFLIISCGNTNTDDSVLQKYNGNNFNLQVPSSWIHVDKKDIPDVKKGQIELAMSSPEISSGFANNILILSDDLYEETTSKKYAIVNYAYTTSSYLEFLKLKEESIEFPDKDNSILYFFEAKYNLETAKRKFIQTAKVCNKKVYLITIGIGLDIVDTSSYENIAKSFDCNKK